MDLNVLKQGARVWLDEVVKIVDSIKVPDFDMGDGNYMRDNSFHIEQKVGDVTMGEDVRKNAIVINCNQLNAKFRSNNFYYKAKGVPTVKGYVEVDMTEIDIGSGLGFKTQISNTGRQVMAVEGVDLIIDMNKRDVKVHIGGGATLDLARIIKEFFINDVVDALTAGIKLAFGTTLPDAINKGLVENDGYANIIPNLWWDWESPDAAVVEYERFKFSSKGLMFDNRTGEVDPGVEIPEMPYRIESNPAALQGFVSSWAIDSFFTSTLSVFNVSGWIDSSMVSNLNTTTMNILLPGISDHYGADVPMKIKATLQKVDNVSISEKKQSMGAHFTLNLEFWVIFGDGETEKAASLTLEDTDFEFSALINDMTLAMQLKRVNVDKIVADYCSFGKLNTFAMKVKFNNAFRFGIPFINKALAAHPIPLPSHLTKYFILSDLTLGYHDEYLEIGLTPTFTQGQTDFVFAQ